MFTKVANPVSVDWTTFDPWRIQAVEHRLMQHPLLQPDQLVALAARLESQNRISTHSNAVTAGTPFNDAASLHPNRRSAMDTLQRIREANAWMSLLNVQTDTTYRSLVDEVLDQLYPEIERRDPGMCYRGGWIFVTSPRTVTPFHIDKEHNFILQIRGTKNVYVWDHRDTEVVSEAARDRFHAHHRRDLIRWDDGFKARARVFHLQPGMGAYMPSTSPHMVENGDEPSITMSFTYYTDSTRRDCILHRAHEWLRERGVEPRPVGARPAIDGVIHRCATSALWAARTLRQLRGRPVFRDNAPYAYAEIGVA
jgi:hypothetical protein